MARLLSLKRYSFMPPPLLSPGSVALFIDWENFKYSLYEVSRLPNIAALMQAVQERYGRPTILRAYADWQDYYHRRSWDQMNLYQAGIEPVYVPTRRSPFGQERIKNSVDVRMSLDCLEVSFTEPHVQTFVLVAGDADFLHVAAALRRRGARVIMIGVSGSTSSRLAGVVDEIVFYDEDIDRVEIDRVEAVPPVMAPDRPHLQKENADLRAEPPKPPRNESVQPASASLELEAPQTALPEISLPKMSQTDVQAALLRLIREEREAEGGRNYPPLVHWLSLRMRDRAPGFSPEKHGLDAVKDLLAEMQTQGLVYIERQGAVNRVWLAEDEAQAATPPIPAHIAVVLAEPDTIPADLRPDFADIVLTASDIENSSRDYIARRLLAKFLYNKGHWDPADLPPQAAPPHSDRWRQRELSEIHKLIDEALDRGVLLSSTYVDPYNGNELPVLELNSSHPFVRKTFTEEQMR